MDWIYEADFYAVENVLEYTFCRKGGIIAVNKRLDTSIGSKIIDS